MFEDANGLVNAFNNILRENMFIRSVCVMVRIPSGTNWNEFIERNAGVIALRQRLQSLDKPIDVCDFILVRQDNSLKFVTTSCDDGKVRYSHLLTDYMKPLVD